MKAFVGRVVLLQVQPKALPPALDVVSFGQTATVLTWHDLYRSVAGYRLCDVLGTSLAKKVWRHRLPALFALESK